MRRPWAAPWSPTNRHGVHSPRKDRDPDPWLPLRVRRFACQGRRRLRNAGDGMMTNSTLALANKIDDEAVVPPAAIAAESPSEAAGGWQAVRDVQKPTSPLTILVRAAEQIDWSGAMQSWTVRLLSLAAGILMWHLACVYTLDFYIR